MLRVLESAIARLRAGQLDRRLCAGEDPVGDALLEARAAQLGAWRARLVAADALQRILRDAARGRRRHRLSPQIPPDHAAVLDAAPVLMALAERLRDGWPAWPPGVALVHDLLADGAGPLYAPREPGDLARRAQRARAELDRDLSVTGPRSIRT